MTKAFAFVLALGVTAALFADVIRVGTPGDYRPFSYRSDASQDRLGIDVDIVRAFATDQRHEIEWVATTWPTLARDVEQDRFDFAIGGISRNADRLEIGAMTRPYFITGKTILARCSFVTELDIEALNRPAHRVIVNPGGTNERFVRRHLDRASVTVHHDNLSVFRELATGPYDFMITDAVEAEIEAAHDAALCGTPGHRFNRVEKAFFGPAGNAYVAAIDRWLEESAGAVTQIIESNRP